MAWFKYRVCGHLKYTNPPRSMAQTTVDGLCPACRIKRRLTESSISVHVRKTLFVHVSAADNSEECVYGKKFRYRR